MEGTTTLDNLPRRIGRYDIAARIAGGGSPIGSEVFIASDGLRASGKAVVIKRLAPGLARNATKVAPYVAVAQDVAKRLHHPNIAEIRAFGGEGPDVYLVMDYIPGETLARFVRVLHEGGQTLPTSTAAYIVAEACAGLDAAHRAGFTHGLLTPYDVFIGFDGKVRVLDIGIAAAKAIAAGEEIPQVRDVEMQYSSPEVCRGQTADAKSDVFSIGAILWELLTGVSPFERAERAAMIRAICEEPIASPNEIRRDAELAERLASTTMSALERDPQKRCSDAGKLRQLLLGHVGADKRAREELARSMVKTFERRKVDKDLLAARVAAKAPTKDLDGLDVNDEPTGLAPLAHGADLDAKIPSGISPNTGGAPTTGPKVVVHRPQSDPSLRTSHPARMRKDTAPLAPMTPVTAPVIAPVSAPVNGAPHPASTEPASTPSVKPPRVPFYDDDEQARRSRQEPTSLISSSAPLKKKEKSSAPILLVAGAIVGVIVAVVIVVALGSKTKHASPKPTASASASVSASASSAVAVADVVPSSTETAAPSATIAAVASSATAASEKTVLSIDTVPSHAAIVLDGKKMGTSPLELKIPKSHDEVTVEIQHAGYVTLKERIVPDVNQRLKLNLVPSKGTTAKPASTNPYRKFE